MVGNYEVITLCGSTKFKDEFIKAQKELTLKGNIVISVGLFGHSGDNEVWNDGVKEMLDDMHKRKIDMADAIMVIDIDGYIGESTKKKSNMQNCKGNLFIFIVKLDGDNLKLFKSLEDKILDNGYENVTILKNYSYDDALIGITSDNKAVYDYDKMVNWLMETENFTLEEAVEWIDYNTIRALPYMGENAPIIMYPLDE